MRMIKILKCCGLVNKSWPPHHLLWVDTCCIDKTNNAELSEAINSMWKWYSNSGVCFAYLADVPRTGYDNNRWRSKAPAGNVLSQESLYLFQQSSWFTRGWTLQELLAPHDVKFCDAQWNVFGTKYDLASELLEITGIRRRYLRDREPLTTASIAMRMSWASNRRTTKKEDMAYCLLGLFDVNMPLLYGEGDKAFMRLQLEIIKKSPDESIFAWKHDLDRAGDSRHGMMGGLLAPSPKAFADSSAIVTFNVNNHQRLPYTMTNQGLELRLPSDSSLNEQAVLGNYRTIQFQTPVSIPPTSHSAALSTLLIAGTVSTHTWESPQRIFPNVWIKQRRPAR